MPRQHRQSVLAFRRAADLPVPLLIVVGLVVAAAVSSASGGIGSAAVDVATPNVVVPDGSPVPCGAPVTSWGSATASDVRVQILGVEHDVLLDGTPTPSAAGRLTIVELEIANQGPQQIRVERADVTVRTCTGQKLHPIAFNDDTDSLLGPFAAGESRAGTLAFTVPDGDQALLFTVAIQEARRTGARVECELVVALDNDDDGNDVAVGCSAFGGNAVSGADASGGDATAPAVDDD